MTADATIPRHVGIIMDGNRRWAQNRGLQPWRGHAKGQEVLRRTAHQIFDRGVKYLTVYAFSTENWKREEKEVGYLMRHVSLALKKYLKEFVDGNVRIVFLGSREALSSSLLRVMDDAEVKTAHNSQATLAVCLNYGGKQELADAAKNILARGTAADSITPAVIDESLYHPEVPELDFLIRTGGERRLSNFMMWRASYAELYFTDTLWPDFSEADLDRALEEYVARQRRFGG